MSATTAQMIEQLQPAGYQLLGLNLTDAAGLLERPYFPITAAQHEHVKTLAEKAGCDSFRVGADGPTVTFGEADGGYALMPLAKDWW